MISNWTSSVALIQLTAWSDKTAGPLWMIFIQFVMYSVVRSSGVWKPTVVDVIKLLENQIDSAFSILLAKLTSCVSRMSCVAGRAEKSEDSCYVSEPPAVTWFEDKSSEFAIVRCVPIASDACDAIRCRVLLPMWANSLSVRIEVYILDA